MIALNLNKPTDLDDLILHGHSKKLMKVKVNQLEKKIIVISVNGKDYSANYDESIEKIKKFLNHLNESNNFIEEMINAQN